MFVVDAVHFSYACFVGYSTSVAFMFLHQLLAFSLLLRLVGSDIQLHCAAHCDATAALALRTNHRVVAINVTRAATFTAQGHFRGFTNSLFHSASSFLGST